MHLILFVQFWGQSVRRIEIRMRARIERGLASACEARIFQLRCEKTCENRRCQKSVRRMLCVFYVSVCPIYGNLFTYLRTVS